jgi:hypothetical protein
MARFGFNSGFYQSQSPAADAQICQNFYPETVESGEGKSATVLYPSPGLAIFAQLPDGPIRQILRVNIPQSPTQLFAIAGGTLFEVFSDGTFNNRGAVANDGKPASMCNSNIQVMIASGGQGYCYTIASQTLSAPVATIAGAVQVGYSDGFFVALIANCAQIFVSNPLDGLTWDAGSTAIVSVYADNAVSMIVDHREICVFGKKQTVCYYDSGNVFPYDVIPGGYAEQGSGATFGTIKADNTVMWIGEDERGKGIAWRAQGYTPSRISNHAIETIWATYPKISDAVVYSFQDQGHTFVHWFFPTANKSWRYDVATQQWHEVCFGEGQNQTAHRSCCHALAFDKHLVGDWLTGTIYQMNIPVADGAGGWNFVTDFGNPIRRVRRSPYFGTPEVWNFPKTFELEVQMGTGPEGFLVDGSGNPRSPQIMLRYSKDAGQTWSQERVFGIGQIGAYSTRVMARRLGRFWGSKGMMLEVSCSDPIPLRIIDGYMDSTPGMQPVDRLPHSLRKQQ